MDRSLRIGVDLGGTKIEAIVARVEARDGELEVDVIARRRVPTERDRGYDHVVDATASLVRAVARDAGISALPAIGVGMPGGVTHRSATGEPSRVARVKNSNTTCLNGRPFHADLEKALGRSIAFDNDANCFALAEAELGAARGAAVAFGVILGTGVGGGLVFRGHAGARATAWKGLHGIAGEWGHISLEPDRGSPCYCGKRGCVETYLSGPAIEDAHFATTGLRVPLADIAAADDAASRETLARACAWFGRALAIVIDVVDPEIIVIGGGASNVDALYDLGVAEARRWVFNDELRTRIVKHTLGDSAGVLGAALLGS
jgi:fructokinase